MVQKKALITGVAGQDGSYLAEFLLGIGYEVHGLVRRSSLPNTGRISHLLDHENLIIHYGDLSDSSRMVRLLTEVKPDEVYNLAAQSHVMMSFGEPEYTGNTTGLGALRLLEGIRIAGLDAKYYQASSSEMFGATLHRSLKNRYFTRGLPMEWRRFTLTGSAETTVSPMACSSSMEFSSTMSRRGGTRNS